MHLHRNQMIALPCEISAGAFSGERTFRIVLEDDREYVGLGHPRYFYDSDGHPLPPSATASETDAVSGLVSARVVSVDDDADTCLVSLPSGDVLRVPSEMAHSHPNPDETRVPIES